MDSLMEWIYPTFLFLAFVGIILYVINPKRKKKYENDAKIPFETLTQAQKNESENK